MVRSEPRVIWFSVESRANPKVQPYDQHMIVLVPLFFFIVSALVIVMVIAIVLVITIANYSYCFR